MVQVLMICCATYHHEVTISPSLLEPFTEDCVTRGNRLDTDDRSLSFALAMMDFVEWDIVQMNARAREGAGPEVNVRWYEYPRFIERMLVHPPSWAAWRKQVERSAGRSAGDARRGSRRSVYFDGLVNDFKKRQDAKKDNPGAGNSGNADGNRAGVPMVVAPEATVEGEDDGGDGDGDDDEPERTHDEYPWDDAEAEGDNVDCRFSAVAGLRAGAGVSASAAPRAERLMRRSRGSALTASSVSARRTRAALHNTHAAHGATHVPCSVATGVSMPLTMPPSGI
jgi:hypothetical protein